MKLSNGYELDFACAAGALAFDGNGWWFEYPARWLGWIRPKEMAITVKTLTYTAELGEYKWYAPWRCVLPIGGGSTVNAVKLTNMGYEAWIDKIWPTMKVAGYDTIVSFMPRTRYEAVQMIAAFNAIPELKALELNLSCPNVPHEEQFGQQVELIDNCCALSKHPVTVKLGISDPIVALARRCSPAAWTLINCPPWKFVHPNRKSPLARLGGGGVSGPDIRNIARYAQLEVRDAGVDTPIIASGSIDSQEEVEWRLGNGANAVQFGTIFVYRPSLPNQIIDIMRGPPCL